MTFYKFLTNILNMIPTSRKWKVTFFLKDGSKKSIEVFCVKRFAKSIANQCLGYPLWDSIKVTVGLMKETNGFDGCGTPNQTGI